MTFLKEKQDIINWLNEHHVQNYDLVADEQYGYVVNVQGDVDLSYQDLTHIPVKFDQVSGTFYCHHNQLSSLEFCPQQVGGYFYCNFNNLISLEFCPQRVDGSFYCGDNQLTTLEFCPQQVEGGFYCNDNELISLEFCPEQVGGKFYCHGNAALQDTQSITDFKAIYQLHREAVIAKNYTQLTQSLAIIDPVSLQKNSVKTKL